MPFTTINGIKVNYLIKGNGPPLLLFAPGGFNSVIGKWTAQEGRNAWKEMDGLETLARYFTLIAYDRREAGLSGGRVEPLTWDLYVEEAKGLLDFAGVKSAYVMGGCMGASLVGAFAAQYPGVCKGLLLHWPVGGYRWMKRGHALMNRHIDFVLSEGLSAVPKRAAEQGNFWADPESGPWAAPLSRDSDFSASFIRQDVDHYVEIIERTRDALFPDCMPSGATADQLTGINVPALVMSGKDHDHTASSAWTIHELMPNSELWDVLPPNQTGSNTLDQILRFTQGLEETSGAA